MPPLRDTSELARYCSVLEQAGRFGGIVIWKPRALEWIRNNLSNHTAKSVVRLMCDHRNEVRQKKEERSEFRDRYPYHYDFVIPIDDVSVYIETVFEPGTGHDDAQIRVVSVHESNK